MLRKRLKTDGEKMTDTLCAQWIKCTNTIEGMREKRNQSCQLAKKALFRGKRGFGLNEVIGIAAGIIIAGLVIIPGLMSFSETVMTRLDSWWIEISNELFKSTT